MAQAHTFLFHLSLGINLLRHEGNSRGEDNRELPSNCRLQMIFSSFLFSRQLQVDRTFTHASLSHRRVCDVWTEGFSQLQLI